MKILHGVLTASLLLAGCPIAADNYGNDGGTADAGNVGDAGPTPTTDAGVPHGSITCSVSAQDDLGTPYLAADGWTGADLADTVATSSDGTTYNVLLEGSNTSSGTFSMELDGLVVGSPTGFTLGSVAFAPGSNIGINDSWTCGAGGACGANVTVTSFDGQTVIGSFSAEFQPASSGSQSSSCSLSSGTFNVTIPN